MTVYPYLRGPLYHSLRRAVIREGELEYLLGRRHDHRSHRLHIRLARAHRTSPGAALVGWAIIGLIVLALAACAGPMPPSAAGTCTHAQLLWYAGQDVSLPFPCAGKRFVGADLSGISNSEPGGLTKGDKSTITMPVNAGVRLDTALLGVLRASLTALAGVALRVTAGAVSFQALLGMLSLNRGCQCRDYIGAFCRR